jgi:hypothetical protein
MKYEIDDAIIKTATKCRNHHACLEGTIPICAVEHCVMHRVHFVKCCYDEPCPYKRIVEGSTVCTCPLRKEIFNRYGE